MSCRADTARPTTADEATPLLELVCAVFLVRIDRRGRSRCSWRALLTGTAGAATARRSPRSRRYAVSPTGCTRTREGSCAADSHSPARAYPRAPPPEALGCMGTPTRLFRTPARLHKTPHSAARDPQSAAPGGSRLRSGGSRLRPAGVGCRGRASAARGSSPPRAVPTPAAPAGGRREGRSLSGCGRRSASAPEHSASPCRGSADDVRAKKECCFCRSVRGNLPCFQSLSPP